MRKCRLAIVATHPIQYTAPVFRVLSSRAELDVQVFYTWSQSLSGRTFDPGFGADIEWDLPLLDGYAHQFVANVAKSPGPHHFNGLNTPNLVREIEHWEPDALLVYTWNSRSHLRVLRHFKGKVPVFFRGDSTLIDDRDWWRARLRRLALTWIYRHVDVAIAVGSNNRDYFAWAGMARNRIALAPHSVDVQRFRDDAAHDVRAARWRAELGINFDDIVILFAGKIQQKKNPRLLLESFAAIGGSAHLVFVGNGEVESELKGAACSMTHVHFMPFQNQSVMPAIYRLADVFVLPSQGPEETWGLALNEAMASGRAVIASSKVGGARDLIQSSEVGWVFESGDAMHLQAVIRTAIEIGKTRLREMGRAAQRLSGEWSTEATAGRIGDAVLAYFGRS